MMWSSEANHLVFHPALRLRRQNNFLHVEGSERQEELERILKAHHGSALQWLGRWIQLHVAADRDVVDRGRARPRWIHAKEDRGRSVGENLSRIEIGGFQHGFNHTCHRGIAGKTRRAPRAGLGTGGAHRPCRSDRSLLRRLRYRRINVEGPSKPDDAQQKHEHQGQHQRGLGDLRPLRASEFARDWFDAQQTADPPRSPHPIRQMRPASDPGRSV